ncbi:hypothetical protein Poly30_48050 [Planctomycetes bacterium Poly30]|uniref:DUF5666 domain-containing protein n=1 Tax=Saltatorellus ferox TaxID=2528018 RepID=A0A518EYS8_9BACT|nr:hypothetical protein Poly30_48050 [Planctomycetes bacterium Poly30]
MTRPVYLIALLTCACSQNNDGNVPTYPTHPILGVIQDAPVDGLQSFSVVITDFDLYDTSGKVTGFVGAAPRRVELMGLHDEGELFASSLVYDGTYAGARVSFDPDTIEAIGADGTLLPVISSVDSFDVQFSAPVPLRGSERLDVLLDLDLARSIQGDPATPPLIFEPRASRIPFDSGTYQLGEVEGYAYTRLDSPNRLSLIPRLWNAGTERGGSAAVAPPDILIDLAPDAVLIDSAGQPFIDEAAFFAAFAQSTQFVEVHCDLRPNGTAAASRIELGGSAQTSSPSEVEGRVVAVDPGGSFDLLVLDIENHGTAISSLLAQSSPPYLFTIMFASETRFIDDPTHTAQDASDLAVGQRVDVLITDTSLPLLAQRVEFESAPEHRATVASTGGLPAGLVVRMTETTAAVTAGLVMDETTNVEVDLASAEIVLSARGERPLAASALVEGLQVELSGRVEGTSTEPTLAASRIRVIAGELTGTISGISAGTSTFDVTVTSIMDPFGGGATSPPFSVTLDPACTFSGAANNESAFFALFNDLAAGQSLRVEVVGIGTASANEVRAYDVRAAVN